jgi:hypothetical protein
VLPEAHHQPSFCGEQIVVSSVASSVGIEFIRPPSSVPDGSGRFVLRAAVPKASVDEHHHSKARERDINHAPYACYGPVVLPKTKACLVKSRAYR